MMADGLWVRIRRCEGCWKLASWAYHFSSVKDEKDAGRLNLITSGDLSRPGRGVFGFATDFHEGFLQPACDGRVDSTF